MRRLRGTCHEEQNNRSMKEDGMGKKEGGGRGCEDKKKEKEKKKQQKKTGDLQGICKRGQGGLVGMVKKQQQHHDNSCSTVVMPVIQQCPQTPHPRSYRCRASSYEPTQVRTRFVTGSRCRQRHIYVSLRRLLSPVVQEQLLASDN